MTSLSSPFAAPFNIFREECQQGVKFFMLPLIKLFSRFEYSELIFIEGIICALYFKSRRRVHARGVLAWVKKWESSGRPGGGGRWRQPSDDDVFGISDRRLTRSSMNRFSLSHLMHASSLLEHFHIFLCFSSLTFTGMKNKKIREQNEGPETFLSRGRSFSFRLFPARCGRRPWQPIRWDRGEERVGLTYVIASW